LPTATSLLFLGCFWEGSGILDQMYNEVNRRKENSMKKKSPKCVPDDEMSKIANSNSGNTAGPSSSPGTSTTQSGSSIANPEISLAHRNRISEEISCAVCLDLLVRPITLVPCGHSLCHSCWTEAKRMDCPECRLVVRCHVPNFLDEGDKAHYLERTRASNEASVVSSDSTSILLEQ
jgi:Zinc finger, C3HC4 type (RING finger)